MENGNVAMRLLERLADEHALEVEGYRELIESHTPELAARAAELALACRREVYGNDVFVRGLIEISNHCKNDCLYCGIRAGNAVLERYRLTDEQILSCCDSGYELGFRTFVMQGGEDAFFTDELLCSIIESIKERYPDCAVTLSLGERGYDSFKRLREAGAERYLLRHETADRAHYERLHPASMSFDNRIASLSYLRELGYQVGAGFMVGSPYQTSATLAEDLKLIEEFKPEMCGIGPFIPHHETQFRNHPRGTLELTCFLLSLIRLACPDVLLPATTALATIAPDGRERGMLAGANVVMPNLSPEDVRGKYDLYDGKVHSGAEAAGNLADLKERMASIGFNIVVDRGDCRRSEWEAQR